MDLGANLSVGQSAAENVRQDSLLRAADQTHHGKKVDRKKIRELSQQFESVFMEIVLKSMRSTINKSDFIDGGNAEDIYKGMLDSEYAKVMSSEGASGLANDIERQLLENMGIKQDVSRITKEIQGRVNYSAQALRPELKQATMKSKG